MFPRPRLITVDHLLLEEGWRGPAWLKLDAQGFIEALGEGAAPEGEAEHLPGWVLPGMPDLHSHAFQRAMTGLGEVAAAGARDDFWSWREAMYRVALRIEPDELEAIAAWLQVELLEGGYTRLGEFHYLHHAPDGRPYEDPTELAGGIVAASEGTGMGLTLLPVLYLHGGFGRPALAEQRRFVFPGVEAYLGYWQALEARLRDHPEVLLGAAPHSLRAVDPESLSALVEALDPATLKHLHAAEQPAEVEGCQEALGARPVAWLLDHQPVDERWCLVHATWLDADETRRLAASGAVAGLCPSTEASLGDGFFPAEDYLAAGGRFGIGSDSQVGASAAGELRLLEWGARLKAGRRCLLAAGLPAAEGRVGQALWQRAVEGGARALGQGGHLAVGRPADLVALDPDHPRLLGHDRESVLSAFLLGGGEGAVSEVLCQGRWVVHQGRHRERERHAQGFARAMRRLKERA
ncbi:MAG: formimidoylglutamate deiminase [Deltaproteobacteria bacterium]|nr:formimidoylglutamate deiminase [Deltaproteobacteria bacterium]